MAIEEIKFSKLGLKRFLSYFWLWRQIYSHLSRCHRIMSSDRTRLLKVSRLQSHHLRENVNVQLVRLLWHTPLQMGKKCRVWTELSQAMFRVNFLIFFILGSICFLLSCGLGIPRFLWSLHKLMALMADSIHRYFNLICWYFDPIYSCLELICLLGSYVFIFVGSEMFVVKSDGVGSLDLICSYLGLIFFYLFYLDRTEIY